MKNQKYRQWCNRKALLAGVLAVSMAVTPMTTAFCWHRYSDSDCLAGCERNFR